MKLLILGGTKFVGRHLTEAALQAGHEVTLFNRGQSNSDLFPNVEKLSGDRDGKLDALRGLTWDAVLDVNGYVPRIVRDSARLLKDKVKRYLFVSTVSVYAEASKPITEDSPLQELENPEVEEVSGGNYGGLKVLCERAVQEIYGERSTVVRPAFVIGPHDHTDRYPYWIWRASQGGKMLVPGKQETTAAIDGRDLGEWMVRLVDSDTAGVFNGQAAVSLLETIKIAKEIAGANTELVPASEAFAEKHELFGAKMPMWIAGEDSAGMRSANNAKAKEAGLKLRSLRETVADTWAWIQEREQSGHEWKTGLRADEEQKLIEELNG